jgi:hypothetical protein
MKSLNWILASLSISVIFCQHFEVLEDYLAYLEHAGKQRAVFNYFQTHRCRRGERLKRGKCHKIRRNASLAWLQNMHNLRPRTTTPKPIPVPIPIPSIIITSPESSDDVSMISLKKKNVDDMALVIVSTNIGATFTNSDMPIMQFETTTIMENDIFTTNSQNWETTTFGNIWMDADEFKMTQSPDYGF